MSDTIQTAMFEILKKIQQDNVDLRKAVSQRFDRLEELMRKQRRDTAGMMVIGKAMASDFAEQMAAVVERVEALEAKRS
ncbi:MAG: hypothetical protein ACKVON_12010 [Beijerinckiaceae bacterium]